MLRGIGGRSGRWQVSYRQWRKTMASYSYLVTGTSAPNWGEIHHRRRVNEHLQKTPEERIKSRERWQKMLDDYRNGIGPGGLLYYDGLLDIEAAMDEADDIADHLSKTSEERDQARQEVKQKIADYRSSKHPRDSSYINRLIKLERAMDAASKVMIAEQ